jgi:hypothetical protein
MTRHINKVWLVLVALAIGMTVACSSSTSTDDAGATDGPAAMSGS